MAVLINKYNNDSFIYNITKIWAKMFGFEFIKKLESWKVKKSSSPNNILIISVLCRARTNQCRTVSSVFSSLVVQQKTDC